LLLALSVALPTYAASQTSRLVAPAPGATVPITLAKTMKAQKLSVGQLVTARLFQRVPLSDGTYLPRKVDIVGHIVSSDPSSLSILFTQLRWKSQTVPIRVRLIAAASSHNVYQTTLPVGGTDRGTSNPADWTTRQVGGDEVYLSAGSGRVYDQYSQPVGYADFHGVYADPASTGQPPRAMGPFSTTAIGLHGLPGFSIISPGNGDTPITFGVSNPKWQLASGGVLLLEVVR
jgi:hypothetical protein